MERKSPAGGSWLRWFLNLMTYLLRSLYEGCTDAALKEINGKQPTRGGTEQ